MKRFFTSLVAVLFGLVAVSEGLIAGQPNRPNRKPPARTVTRRPQSMVNPPMRTPQRSKPGMAQARPSPRGGPAVAPGNVARMPHQGPVAPPSVYGRVRPTSPLPARERQPTIPPSSLARVLRPPLQIPPGTHVVPLRGRSRGAAAAPDNRSVLRRSPASPAAGRIVGDAIRGSFSSPGDRPGLGELVPILSEQLSIADIEQSMRGAADLAFADDPNREGDVVNPYGSSPTGAPPSASAVGIARPGRNAEGWVEAEGNEFIAQTKEVNSDGSGRIVETRVDTRTGASTTRETHLGAGGTYRGETVTTERPSGRTSLVPIGDPQGPDSQPGVDGGGSVNWGLVTPPIQVYRSTNESGRGPLVAPIDPTRAQIDTTRARKSPLEIREWVTRPTDEPRGNGGGNRPDPGRFRQPTQGGGPAITDRDDSPIRRRGDSIGGQQIGVIGGDPRPDEGR